jgi:hypothetical protein
MTEEYIAEFLYDGKLSYYKIQTNRKGKITKSSKLKSKPDLEHYTQTTDMYEEIGMDFISSGLILVDLWKSNDVDDYNEDLLELFKRMTKR